MGKGYVFIVIGVGGIGGAVARDLPKLLIKSPHRIVLIDGDVVEQKNTVRQPYQKQDVGLNKARALAKKINSFYPVNCQFVDKFITDKELDVLLKKYDGYLPVFIGCVDNDATRKIIEKTFMNCENAAYIDGANSEYDGNIYFSKIIEKTKFGPVRSDAYTLSDDVNPGVVGCEEQLSNGQTQFFITNNKVASIMLEKIDNLITHGKEAVEGVTIVERFKTISY